ncbi:MAG: anthranilate phosphoribosyltransferase [bacterium]
MVDAGPPDGPQPVFTEVLQRLAEKRDLTRAEAAWALDQIVDGTVGETQAAAFLMGLRVKGETAEEIAGLVETTRRRAVSVDVPENDLLVDSAGTGGDNLGTFNISTTAAFVTAGAGAKVAKHGNRAASSRCGSADVLEALGVRVDLGPREVAECLDRVGMGFMLASLYHPAAGRVAALRRALGIRTVFNLLGPLANPAGARRQLLGVCAPEHMEMLAGALARLGCERALLVHGDDGMDELSVTGPSAVVEVAGTTVDAPYILDPEEYGIPRYELAALAGGDPEENADITRKVLAGLGGGPRDAVVLNAAAALYVAGRAPSIREGLGRARESVDSGHAAGVLESLIAVTNELGERSR